MPSGHPPAPNSIIVGNCISCSGLVRVSAKAKANANVRCPHCQQTFPLVSLLESAVPEVEVLETQAQVTPVKELAQKQELYIDQTAETAKDASGKFVVPSQLAKGARRRKSSRSGRSRSRSSSQRSETERSSHRRSSSRSAPREEQRIERFDKTAHNTQTRENISHSGSRPQSNSVDESLDHNREIQTETRSSPSRSEPSLGAHRSTRHRDARAAEALQDQPNPAMNFLKVIAGACLALPIAYLIVMWVFTQDPLGIGQGLGEKLPFAVPAVLRGELETDDDAPDTTEQNFLTDDENSSFDPGFEDLNVGGEALRGFEL